MRFATYIIVSFERIWKLHNDWGLMVCKLTRVHTIFIVNFFLRILRILRAIRIRHYSYISVIRFHVSSRSAKKVHIIERLSARVNYLNYCLASNYYVVPLKDKHNYNYNYNYIESWTRLYTTFELLWIFDKTWGNFFEVIFSLE